MLTVVLPYLGLTPTKLRIHRALDPSSSIKENDSELHHPVLDLRQPALLDRETIRCDDLYPKDSKRFQNSGHGSRGGPQTKMSVWSVLSSFSMP